MTEKQNMFEKLNAINVNDHTEQKNGLTYLSWAYAWAEFKSVYPEATYEVYKNEQGLPYVYDPNTGYMVYVTVTAGGMTHEMWLPVMDSGNNAMKSEPYEIRTKYKTITVKPATMFDVNKTIMRALVKCLAMFGLGLYIYAGEDLPECDKEPDKTSQFEGMPAVETTRESLIERIRIIANAKGIQEAKICELSKNDISSIEDMEYDQLQKCLEWLGKQ